MLNCWVARVMYGLELFKYNNLPINLLYKVTSSMSLLPSRCIFLKDLKVLWQVLMSGVMCPLTDSRFRQYSLGEVKIPFFQCATLKPRKYFKIPKSFILKLLSRMLWCSQTRIEMFMLVWCHQHILVGLCSNFHLQEWPLNNMNLIVCSLA